MDRRTFVSALGAPAFLSAQSPNDTIRVAFVGVGNRGSYLLRHTLTIPGIKVVAICDIEPATLRKGVEQATKAGHSPAGYGDFRKMLDEEQQRLKAERGEAAWRRSNFPRAGELLDAITTADEFATFLTLSAYRELA